MTNRDKAENLWQTLSGVLNLLSNGKGDVLDRRDIRTITECLTNNRPNSEETEIDQDKQFAKLVYNELPLSSDVPLVNRLINICKERLDITDND